jgi:hypothetical protein
MVTKFKSLLAKNFSNNMLCHALFFVNFVIFSHFMLRAMAHRICSDKTADSSATGICPDGNTCCRLSDGKSWGCIAADMGQHNATCCQDDLLTGCPVGYVCRPAQHDCKASSKNKPLADPLTEVLPRYLLCTANEIYTIHGLPVHSTRSNNSTFAEIPYYSNKGALYEIPADVSLTVDIVIVVVHGATRNGDDYFCSIKPTVELQDRFYNVLIIALNYYSVSDERPRETILFWDSRDTDGNWRYGADSSGPIRYSSFAVLDQVILQMQLQFLNLQRITVIGHSSGGQLVQRWALLSAVPQNSGPYIQIVVANPSNYAYLSPHRFLNGSWTIPNINSTCSQYDQWEWGLQDGGIGRVPYRDRALQGNVSAVLERYKSRSVIYLVGGVDRCNISESEGSGWCYSHGLETKCMDELQGHNRYERNSRYMASLRRLGFWNKNHRQLVVPGVGHDHSMMFQSPVGVQAIYYEMVSAKLKIRDATESS